MNNLDTFLKIFIADYIEDLEDAVNDYAKENNCKLVSVSSIISLGTCLSAAATYERGLSNAE